MCGLDHEVREPMKLVIAVIKPFKLEEVREALTSIGVQGLMVSEVKGYGRQSGHTEIYRGAEYVVNFVPKIKLELVVPETILAQVIETLSSTAKTGKIGDGKIFVLDVEQAARVRTGETEEKTQSMEIMLEAPKAAMADPAADRIRDTLKAELKAFRKHDIEAAYSYASDKARTKYKTPKQFFRVMKNTCGPLSDHLSYSFLDRSRVGDAIFQKMQFVGANGIPTKGVFRLIQDENGLWRTDSCIMFETDAPAV